MDPRIGDDQLPVQKERILLVQLGAMSNFQCVALDIVDAFFKLFLLTKRARSRGPEDKTIVLSKGADYGIELGIKPVGLFTVVFKLSRTIRLSTLPKWLEDFSMQRRNSSVVWQ